MQSQQAMTPTTTQLTNRIEALERAFQELRSSYSSRASEKMQEREEEYRRKSEAKARDILKRTHGMISKERGEQMLRDLEASRNQ